MEGFQLAASRGCVEAENRREVSRFPLRPQHSRFKKSLLIILSECPPDGARLFEGLYIVSNTRPDPRSLHYAAQDAQLCVEGGGADALFHLRCADNRELEQTLEHIRAAEEVERTDSVIVLSRLVARG